MKIQINIPKMISILILAVAFLNRWNGKVVLWYVPYVVCIPLYVFYGWKYINESDTDSKKIIKSVFGYIINPYLLALVYSLFLDMSGNGIINSSMRAFTNVSRKIVEVFLAISLFIYYRDQVMDVIGDSLIVSYFITMINSLSHVGVKGLIEYISSVAYVNSGLNKWFEMHDLGFSVGFVIIYELCFNNKKSIIKQILLILIFLMCWKRIAFLAIAISVMVYIVIRKKNDQTQNHQVRIIMLGIYVSSIIYVMITSTGALYDVAEKMGFDFSNRRFLYIYISRFYKWSISFMGHGLGSVGKYLTSVVGTSAGLGAGSMMQVHNDILKTYIELGFVGSFLWFLWYFELLPRAISSRTKSKYIEYVYCIIISYAFVVYMTDNAMEYFIFQMTLYAFTLFGCFRSEVYENGNNIINDSNI